MRSLCSARGMNDARRDPAPFGVVPAHQRLEADDSRRRQVHDRLVVHGELAVLQRLAQLLDEREAADGLLVHARREDRVAAPALTLGLVEGDVGSLDAAPRCLRRLPSKTTTPMLACCSRLSPSIAKGSAKHVEQPRGDFLRLVRRGEALGEVEELVAAESTQRVGRTRDQLETPRDTDEQLVADEVTVGVVHALEVVEVEQQHRAVRRPVAATRAWAWRKRSSKSARLARPVRESWSAWWESCAARAALFGDVALGGDEVEDLARGVAGRRRETPRDDDPSVLSQVALDVADLVDLLASSAASSVSSVMPTSSG